MNTNIVNDLQNHFRNKVLNFLGVERDLYQLLADKDVDKAIELMQNRDEEVDNALSEYHPQQHKVMSRPNKRRDKEPDYVTEKLPRNLQSYINEIELFFLLGQPILWKKNNGSDDAFGLFTSFIKDTRFNAMIRQVKRIAGSETEAALVYRLYNNNGNREVLPFVVARSEGYSLRVLFDQYKQLKALAYGYTLRESNGNVKHWDILTPDYIFETKQAKVGYEVDVYDNPIGKIAGIYFQQNKAWFGAEPRLDRIEDLDSKTADTNNYFADPIAEATADVIQNLAKPDQPGRLIQLTGANSRFGYVAPPNGSQSRQEEKTELKETVLFDTLTPNFDVEKMRGFGTLTGAAIKNTFAIGYIKRDKYKEIYEGLIDRQKNVIVAILKYLHPEMEEELDELDIAFEFADPFTSDKENRWSSIANLYGAGVISLETAVQMLGIATDQKDEVNRIMAMEMDKLWTANEAKGVQQPSEEQQDAENRGEQPATEEGAEE